MSVVRKILVLGFGSGLVVSASMLPLIPDPNQIASAQEHRGCFGIDHSGRVVNLNGICIRQETQAQAEKPQIVRGIALSNLALVDQSSSLPLMVGKITNTTNKTVEVKRITLQLEDKATGNVVTTQTPTVTAILAPGQSREFRELVGKDIDLGSRRAFEIRVDFVDWQ